MSELYKNIRKFRLLRGLTQNDLAKMMGYRSKSTIAKIESGKNDIPQSKIKAFADVLSVSVGDLLGWDDESFSLPSNILPVPEMRKIPLLGTIACGEPILATENIEGEVDIPKEIHADFALRCKGDSMINARIFNGDIVYIRQQDIVDDNEIAAVLINDEATLKRVRLYPDHIVLEPSNPMYQPLSFWKEEMNEVHILGKAVAFTSMIR